MRREMRTGERYMRQIAAQGQAAGFRLCDRSGQAKGLLGQFVVGLYGQICVLIQLSRGAT